MKKGFEIFYFDGTGLPPVKIMSFEELLKFMGEIDGDGILGTDEPFVEGQLSLPYREFEEPKSTGTGEETSGGAATYGGL